MSENNGLWDEAREESNIYAAISFFRRKVELCEAVIDNSFYKFLKNTSSTVSHLIMILIVPGAILALLGLIIIPKASIGLCAGGGLVVAMILSQATIPYYSKFLHAHAERKVLLALLKKLEALYAINRSADVGFMLDATGNYDLETIEGMIKATKKKMAASL